MDDDLVHSTIQNDTTGLKASKRSGADSSSTERNVCSFPSVH